MKIGIVAYEMEGPKTGVGRYLEGLLSGVAQGDRPWQWLLFFKGRPFDHELWSDDRFTPLFDRRPAARPILWEQLRLPRLLRRERLDFLFSPAYSLPRAPGVPAMLTVHDLSFESRGGELAWKERWRRRLLARRAVRRAARVLADTAEIARELEAAYGLTPEKIGVVPLGIDAAFFATSEAGGDGTPGVEGARAPYLLYVGSILERRHVDLAIAAFAEVAPRWPALRLVLAGQNRLRRPRELRRWIEESGCGDRIVEVGYVAENALAGLYREAELSYYLSSYEGYGLPPLESLAAGTPAVVGRGLALDDLWPEYPYRCLLLDRETVAETTRRALEHGDERRRLAAEGRERMARLTWKRSAELFLAEIDRVVAP